MKRKEPNVFKQWLKSEEQRDVFTGADHVSRRTSFGQGGGLFEIGRTRTEVGELLLLL